MMTWEQKLEALNSLCEHSLIMRAPGDWYVSSDLSIIDQCISSGDYGNGDSPEEAVEDHWDRYSSVAFPMYISNGTGKRYRWNKFMWKEVHDF